MVNLAANYWVWIPLLIFTVALQSFISVKNNNGTAFWFWVSYWYAPLILIALPLWTWVSKCSRNIVFDAILFDSIMIIVYTFSIAIFSQEITKFSPASWIGISLVLAGLFIFRL